MRDILRNAVSAGGAPRPALGTRLKSRFERLGLTADIPELRGHPATPAGFRR
ncbi:MAG: hypothetical protein HYT81_06385 [Gemmatimonadetes bacterium]|nr:hypothetical protein [Gemmatimonadota bacterium]MBI2401525.1 hypothetical protein [Gemmatimonadota bacterium]